MQNPKKMACLVLVLGALALSVPSAYAKTPSDLVAEGYTCERVSVGFVECRKAGVKAWWCSGNSCEQAPRVAEPAGGGKPPRVFPGNAASQSSGGVMSQP